MEFPERKPLRLKRYDYAMPGTYFVTICAYARREVFSRIDVGQGLAPAVVRLSEYGKIAEQQLHSLELRYPAVKVEHYVIMPNHIHILMTLRETPAGASPCPTLSRVIGVYKSLTTRLCNRQRPIGRLFQTSFHDHVVRGDKDFQEIWQYIDHNPAHWAEDRFYRAVSSHQEG